MRQERPFLSGLANDFGGPMRPSISWFAGVQTMPLYTSPQQDDYPTQPMWGRGYGPRRVASQSRSRSIRGEFP